MLISPSLGKRIYFGVFLTSLATLMFEILLTRIFSVTMLYHFAFMAISLAIFGLTVGGIVVYLLPLHFRKERIMSQLALYSWIFAVTLILSLMTHLLIYNHARFPNQNLISTYVIISIPFVFSGIVICLVLTKFPENVNGIYAADLSGAAAGCIALIYALRFTDGPTSVILVAILANLASILFLDHTASKGLRWIIVLSAFALGLFAAVQTVFVWKQLPLLHIQALRGRDRGEPLLYEKWNSFSRVIVWGNAKPSDPFGWGMSRSYNSQQKISQLMMTIDSRAGTVLTSFDYDFKKLEYLKYDVTNVVQYIRRAAQVLVVGTGGGRDIISALAFHQKSVLGVEINNNVIDAVNVKFGDFTNHLDFDPRVRFVNDEARSYIARQRQHFDIIQVSGIDTFAATAAGAFVLSENSLYTVEAWKLFLEKLSSQGVLSFSRWYVPRQPAEAYRLTSLAVQSLLQSGIPNPRSHIVIVALIRPTRAGMPDGVATMLVSKMPFSEADLKTIEQVAKKMDFNIILSPRFSINPNFEAIASGKNVDAFLKEFPLNVQAPTDDSPFFFNMLRFRDIFKSGVSNQGQMSFNQKAVAVLGELLLAVVSLCLLCIVVPLLISRQKESLKGSFHFFVFFLAIGFGFMLVEISQLQRLIVFLGSPTYGLSVVLFTLLLSSGLGSYISQGVRRWDLRILLSIPCIMILFGILTPHVVSTCRSWPTPLSIVLAIGMLFPLGLLMGMAFPFGMRMANATHPSLTPWLWGMNGAATVCASVLAVVLAMSYGISLAYWSGVVFYLVAFLAFLQHKRISALAESRRFASSAINVPYSREYSKRPVL